MPEEPSTVQETDEQIHDRLMAQAEADDIESGRIEAPVETTPSVKTGAENEPKQGEGDHAPEPKTEKQADNPEASAEEKQAIAEGRKRDPVTGQFLPKEQKPAEPVQQQKQDSEYERAKKEEARKEKTWQQIEQEKAEVRAERARLDQERAQLQRQPQGQQQQGPRFRSSQFAEAARDFEREAWQLIKEGDEAGAQEKLSLANKAMQAGQVEYNREQTEAVQSFQQQWETDCASFFGEYPDLKDGRTELAQKVVEFLDQEPYLRQIPHGFEKALKAVLTVKDAAEASGLREENKKLKTEVERLTAKLSPLGGKGTSAHTPSQKFENMTHQEQHDYLAAQAEAADGF